MGAYFAKSAYLEAASVIAFERLHDELVAHGAPAELCARALRARDDEQRHARVVGALAMRFGAIVAPVVADGPRERSLFEIARENVVEGVVRETFAAALAMHKAAHAGDATVRATLQEIAYDECRHGELSLAIDRWIRGLLTSVERACLDDAAREAVRELRAELESEPPPALVEIAGLPRSREARRLVDALTSLLWRRTSLAA